MSEVRDYFVVALRRCRLQAAIALAEQNHAPEATRLSLAEQLGGTEEELAQKSEGGGQRVDELPSHDLARRLGLRPIDERVLWFAVALEVDPLFSVTATALAGAPPRQGLYASLIGQMLRFASDEAVSLRLGQSHPLVAAGLLESAATADVADTLRPFRASTRFVSFLEGNNEIDPLLDSLGGVVPLAAGADFSKAPALPMLERALGENENVIISIEGADGVGRRSLVALAARALGREVIALDASRLAPGREQAHSELRALRRECWLRGAVPLVARLDGISRRPEHVLERLSDVAAALESRGAVAGPAVITATSGAELPQFARRVIRLRLDAPVAAERPLIWARALLAPDPATNDSPTTQPPSLTDVPPTVLPLPKVPPTLPASVAKATERYSLTPGGIQRAAHNARLRARGRELTADDVHAGVAAEIEERFGGLATRIVVTQSWDDLVLPEDTLDEVKAFSSRATHAALVYDQWGFRDKLGRGLGLAALFSGPPGTGKTMVAGLVARALGLELYMVDLSQVVSKWVGETEKQLGRIFDAAGMGQSLLLFDEADALFARRTEVKSSNDRYANMEVNYLLQRIEQFGGVAILTTNFEGSVDPAFKRRLAADVRFHAPERDERERLWRSLLPASAPVVGPLDFARLAEEFKDMCGGNIRNAVLRAAFLAAGEDLPVSEEHLVRAARVEYRSMGKVL